jgi:hypothetical protein
VLPFALVSAMIWPATARAQFGMDFSEAMAMRGGGGAPAISAVGTSTVQLKPTCLRLYIQLSAKGKTLEEALDKLKERREAATTQLESLKVDSKSIVFGSPSVSNAASAKKRQMEMMIMAQMRGRGKKPPKGLQAQPPVTVIASLTAQWPLEAESQEQMLIMAQKIQDKIKDADLGGAKEAEESAEAQEEMEEEAAQAMNRYGEDTPQPGQPQFVFVAVLPKSEREKAMNEAFANAKKNAAELAKAAGVELGPLAGLSGTCHGQTNLSGGYGMYGHSSQYEFVSQIVRQQTGDGPEEKPDEAMGADPGMLKFVCVANVLFHIGK